MTTPERIWATCTTPDAQKKRGDWHEYPYGTEYIRADLAAAQPAQEVHEEQNTEQSKRFWNWLPLAYRDGHIGEQAKFTKYNMEVAHYAGWCHALEPQPDPRDEVIARLVEALENRLHDQECPCNACSPMLAALAAAKAVQHG